MKGTTTTETNAEMTTGSLMGLQEGGVVTLELMKDADTDEMLIALLTETENGTEVELAIRPDEAVDLATDLLMFAQQCRDHNRGGEQA